MKNLTKTNLKIMIESKGNAIESLTKEMEEHDFMVGHNTTQINKLKIEIEFIKNELI